MKQQRSILLIGLVLLSINISGQDLRLLNTKDLIKISENYGLDSALRLTSRIPIYSLDKITAKKLIELTLKSKPSDRVECFLVDYSLHIHDKNLSDILYNYFDRERNNIQKYEPADYFGSLPEISEDALVALIDNSLNKTDSLLFKYYNEWNEKSKKYQSDYLKGQTETNSRVKEKLMSPFEACNFNCYIVMKALDSLKSNLFDNIKMEAHQKNLKVYLQGGFHFEKHGDFTDYNKQEDSRILELEKSYKSLAEIDFAKEPALLKLQERYNESFCWKFLMYNETKGFLDLGCQWEPLAGHGELYRIELIGKTKLKIVAITDWIS